MNSPPREGKKRVLHESTLDRLTFPGVFLLVAAFAFLPPTPSFLTHLLAAPGYTHAEPLALRRADRRAALPQCFRRRPGRAARAGRGVGLLPRCLGVRPRPLPRPPCQHRLPLRATLERADAGLDRPIVPWPVR